MLNEDELRDAVLLVFANKQDLPNAMSASDLTEKLGLQSLRQRTWYIQGTCATSGTSHAIIMLSSCYRHAVIMLSSCRHHAIIMLSSCRHHDFIMLSSYCYHAVIMPSS